MSGFSKNKLQVWPYLDMVWSQDDPATEAVAQIDDGHTAAEPNNVRKGCSERHNQDLRGRKRINFWQAEKEHTPLTTEPEWFKSENKKWNHWCNVYSSLVLNRPPSMVRECATYVVLLEEREVTNDSDPHQEGGGPQQDAAQVIRRHILSGRRNTFIMVTWQLLMIKFLMQREGFCSYKTESFKYISILGWLTFDSMPILMMLPVMVRMSLMMRRMYQPLINSNRSAQATLRSRISLKKWTYS